MVCKNIWQFLSIILDGNFHIQHLTSDSQTRYTFIHKKYRLSTRGYQSSGFKVRLVKSTTTLNTSSMQSVSFSHACYLWHVIRQCHVLLWQPLSKQTATSCFNLVRKTLLLRVPTNNSLIFFKFVFKCHR